MMVARKKACNLSIIAPTNVCPKITLVVNDYQKKSTHPDSIRTSPPHPPSSGGERKVRGVMEINPSRYCPIIYANINSRVGCKLVWNANQSHFKGVVHWTSLGVIPFSTDMAAAVPATSPVLILHP